MKSLSNRTLLKKLNLKIHIKNIKKSKVYKGLENWVLITNMKYFYFKLGHQCLTVAIK
jgi:hypothetical protein